MPEPLLTEHWQRSRNSVQYTFYIDIDHILPILNAQLIKGRYRHHAGIVDQNIELAVPFTGQVN
ncbi:hypothetical protein D3C73_1373750 [compost metagenome]